MNEEQTVPLCPGCHVGCKLDRWQCGKGKAFLETWQQGGEIPRRNRRRRGGGKPDSAPELSASEQAVRLLNIVPKALQRYAGETSSDKLLATLERHGRLMSRAMLAKELGTDAAGIEQAVAKLEEQGAVYATQEHATDFVGVSDAGKELALEQKRAHEERHGQFLETLDEDELGELTRLLEKLLSSHKHAGPGPHSQDHRAEGSQNRP